MVDIRIEDHGSIVLLDPETDAAREWLEEHTADDVIWWGGSLAVEPRYVADIVNGAREAGLEVQCIAEANEEESR